MIDYSGGVWSEGCEASGCVAALVVTVSLAVNTVNAMEAVRAAKQCKGCEIVKA
jgi:hypothetical protein